MQNPVPSLILPAANHVTIPGAQQSNNQAIIRWGKTVTPRLFAIGEPIFAPNGAPPTPPSDAYLLQRGRVPVTISGGDGTLTLPSPFPNGWLSLVLEGGGGDWYYDTVGVTLGQINVFGPSSTMVDIDAVGW